MNFLNNTYFKICLIIEIFIIIGVDSFTPLGRVALSSALVGTKLYFFGGTIANEIFSNEVFYLDLSQTFNIASPPFVDLTESAKMPFKGSWAGTSLIDTNNDPTVYLFGGIMRDPVTNTDSFVSVINSFNIKTSSWNIPYINGKAPARRRDVNLVKDDSGKIYIFSGFVDNYTGSAKSAFLNDMIILDTIRSTWTYGSTINASAISAYTATILTNGVIVYIGGLSQVGKLVDINQISLYDTKLDTWSKTVAKSINVIESRCSHSAVLAPDGNIIIFGGGKLNAEGLLAANPDVAVLNIKSTPYEWSYPTMPPSNANNQPPSMYGHTAKLIGNYMIIAFGSINPSINFSFNSKVYIMDTRNYTWIDTFEAEGTNPNSTSTQNTGTSSNSNNNNNNNNNNNDNNDTTKIVIGVLCGVIGVLLLGIIGFFGIRWYKKKQNGKDRDGILNISGSNETSNTEILKIPSSNRV